MKSLLCARQHTSCTALCLNSITVWVGLVHFIDDKTCLVRFRHLPAVTQEIIEIQFCTYAICLQSSSITSQKSGTSSHRAESIAAKKSSKKLWRVLGKGMGTLCSRYPNLPFSCLSTGEPSLWLLSITIPILVGLSVQLLRGTFVG